ncbi:Shedu immune nuclease family protein [Micromonospora sp. NPDC002717]|uniref:Shedu immune nuclease family protein n=1 Tax=Micromonospora sp. NPDC002717 TaxID=3154424 RepID=UPI00331DEE94
MRQAAVRGAFIKRLYSDFGGTCAAGDCPYPSRLPDGTPILQIVYIRSARPGGPRWDPTMTLSEEGAYENLLLLCPSHHELIDRLPDQYNSEWLTSMRQRHIERVTSILASLAGQTAQPSRANRFREALAVWERERLNASEGFWQNLFASRPELLMPTLSGRPYVLNEQCYVGGKSISNRGGRVPDFLAQCHGNAVLIELKTPATKLVGARYRNNVYPPSTELIGACVQALEYRVTLMNYLHSLRHETPELAAHSPTAVVIAGDAHQTRLTEPQRRSFEIFRTSLKDLNIITYDELFLGIENLAAMLDPSSVSVP